MSGAIGFGTSEFTMSALPSTPAIQNAIPMPFFGTTHFAAQELGLVAAAIMLAFGLWCLGKLRPPRAATAFVRDRCQLISR
jgi:H+/gluconate symporter-like permease